MAAVIQDKDRTIDKLQQNILFLKNNKEMVI